MDLQGLGVPALRDQTDIAGDIHTSRTRVDAGGPNQVLALASRATLLKDVGLKLLAKVAQGTHDRPRRELAEGAERIAGHLLGDMLDLVKVLHAPLALGDAREQLEHTFAAHSAGDTLATRLCCGKSQEELGQLYHTGILVHDDHTTGAHHGACLTERVKIDLEVQARGGQTTTQRTTRLHGLEMLVIENAATDVKDDLAHGDAHGDLDQTGVGDLARQSKDGRSGASRRANVGKPLGAIDYDLRDSGIALDIVVIGGLAPKARDRRKGRAGTRLAAFALDGSNKSRLFATDKGARAFLDHQFEGKTRVQDVLAQQAVLLSLSDGHPEALDGQRVLGATVDIPLVRTDTIAGDDHALQYRMGISLQHRAIHKGPRIPFVSVADQILDIATGPGSELPLEAGEEPGAAAPSQARLLDLVDDILRGHLDQHLGQRLIAPPSDVLIDALGIDNTAVAQRQAHLFAIKGNIGIVRN